VELIARVFFFYRRTAIALCRVGVRFDGSTDVTFVMLYLPPPTHRGTALSYHCDAIVWYDIYMGLRILVQVAVGARG
jgi:hypothetical protein